jgi:hypothetical protein
MFILKNNNYYTLVNYTNNKTFKLKINSININFLKNNNSLMFLLEKPAETLNKASNFLKSLHISFE